MTDSLPILYSFRRCPYAMRARMAIAVSGLAVELREVVLRDKPAAMITASAKGTVPVLVLSDGTVIDESIDVMAWALAHRDPQGWLAHDRAVMDHLIADNDGPFKYHLDRFKYASRYETTDPSNDPEAHRAAAEPYLLALNDRLMDTPYLMGTTRSLADIAIFPFVRQFASAARARHGAWMQDARFEALNNWLGRHVASDLFVSVMGKYPQWLVGEPGICFPG